MRRTWVLGPPQLIAGAADPGRCALLSWAVAVRITEGLPLQHMFITRQYFVTFEGEWEQI